MKIWMKFGKSSIAAVVVCMALFVATPMAAEAHEKSNSVSVVPITDKVDGKTYGQWSAEWWHRAFEVTSFDRCAQMNQPEPGQANGPVFFLAGTVVLPNPMGGTFTRPCTIPAGKFIIFPILNAAWSQAEALGTGPGGACLLPGVTPTGTEYAALLACAKAQLQTALAGDSSHPGATFSAVVDGTTLDLRHQEAVSPPPLFSIDVVANNPFCPLIAGPTPGSPPIVPCPVKSLDAADGIWIILNPLSAGSHTIHLHLEVPIFGLPSTDVIYNLMVL